MDEQTPSPSLTPVATPVGPSPQPAQPGRGIYLVLGVTIGAVIVLAVLYLGKTQEKPVVYQAPPKSAPAPTATGSTPGVSPNAADSTAPPGPSIDPANAAVPMKIGAGVGDSAKPGPTTGGSPATSPNATPPKGGTVSSKGVGPYNPFAGSAMPPKQITGNIKPHPDSAIPKNPGPGPGPMVAPNIEEDPASKGLLVTIRLEVSDPNGAVRALKALASKLGGSAIQYDENAMKQDAEGAVLFVPANKALETEKRIASVGGVIATDKWNGSSGERIDRIERPADDRLSDLHIQRQELVVKYFEDAPQVKHIDEDSDRINRCLSALRAQKPGPNTAVIKIKFLG